MVPVMYSQRYIYKILEKWTIADGQFNLVPFSNGKPLNAIEFQDVIVSGKEIKLFNLNGLVSQKT